jgi:hypothetical protein
VASVAVLVAGLWGLGSALGSSSLARDPSRKIHLGSGEVATITTQANTGDPAEAELDPALRIERLKQRVQTGQKGWRHELVEAVLDPTLPLLYRDQAWRLLRERAGRTFGHDPEAAQNAEAARRMRAWAREEP